MLDVLAVERLCHVLQLYIEDFLPMAFEIDAADGHLQHIYNLNISALSSDVQMYDPLYFSSLLKFILLHNPPHNQGCLSNLCALTWCKFPHGRRE